MNFTSIMPKAKVKNVDNELLDRKLWKAADNLRKNIDAAEYKQIVLGLIFQGLPRLMNGEMAISR